MPYPRIAENISRANSFGTLAQLLKLATAIADAGWHQSSVCLVTDADKPDIAADAFRAMAGTTKRVALAGKTLPVQDIVDALDAQETTATAVVAGNRRILAVRLLAVFGVAIRPCLAKAKAEDLALANIQENAAQSLALGLQAEQRLASAIAAGFGGAEKEMELAPLGYARGVRQQLMGHLILARRLPDIERAAIAKIDKESARAYGRLPLDDCRAAVLAHGVGKTTALSAKAIRELAGLARGAMANLLLAVAEGRKSEAVAIIDAAQQTSGSTAD